MANDRPNPDELLARVQTEEAKSRRGSLKIFFGYAAGVGKTFAMLEAARREKASGVEVVVGYVEPHGRAETESLLEGLESLPLRQVPYRGVTLREFDLDAALTRKPRLLLVDELAHTNAEGSRHAKRWQDVEELLQAGIDVYSTLNVQHLESLNDIIAQISGVIVRETLPDSVLEQADDFELIDLTPEELMERLQKGKVYMPTQAERALRNFFQPENLTALRELSLRQAANRLRHDVDAARQTKSAFGPWATNDRLLVCVGPSPTTAKLIRTAKRMATALGAEWLAVAVDAQGAGPPKPAVRDRIAHHLRLAEQLGAETHTLVGTNVADTLLEYARSRNVTKIIVGKTALPWWKRLAFSTVVDDLLDRSGEIDIYVIKGEKDSLPPAPSTTRQTPIAWPHYYATAFVLGICATAGWFSARLHLAEANTVMIFLLGIALVASRFGRGPAVFAAVGSVLVFDFVFVPPFLTFAVSDTQYLFTFAVMLAIGLIISTLTARLRDQLHIARQQETRTGSLYRLTKQLSQVAGRDFLVGNAGQQIKDIFPGEVVIYVRDGSGPLLLAFGAKTAIAQHPINPTVAQWVADHDQMAGVGTDTLPNATALFVPLQGSQNNVGVLGVRPADVPMLQDPEQLRLLETCASLIALSLERDQSILEANQAQVQIETEQLRNSLLSSVSHDLRTPLAAIAGAGASLLESSPDETTRRELLQGIIDESHRLTRLVENLLEMTRLEAGQTTPQKQWHVLEEIVGSARRQVAKVMTDRSVRVDLPVDLPLVAVDGLLLEQVFVNLLENAARYTPPGSTIEIFARALPQRLEIHVADNGPGLPPGSEERLFEKFYRASTTQMPDGRRGVGLGLAICQGIMRAHGGSIVAKNRPTGGAEFVLSLPCKETPPHVTIDALDPV